MCCIRSKVAKSSSTDKRQKPAFDLIRVQVLERRLEQMQRCMQNKDTHVPAKYCTKKLVTAQKLVTTRYIVYVELGRKEKELKVLLN